MRDDRITIDGAGGDAAGRPSRMCATCRHRASHTPMTCGLFLDEEARKRLCHEMRAAAGACGPEGAFWAQNGGADVIQFPGDLRWPRSGGFDGGHAA